jgi:glutathionylspermidine synthase
VYNTVLKALENNADVSTFVFQDAVTQEELIIDSKFLVNTRNNDINNI